VFVAIAQKPSKTELVEASVPIFKRKNRFRSLASWLSPCTPVYGDRPLTMRPLPAYAQYYVLKRFTAEKKRKNIRVFIVPGVYCDPATRVVVLNIVLLFYGRWRRELFPPSFSLFVRDWPIRHGKTSRRRKPFWSVFQNERPRPSHNMVAHCDLQSPRRQKVTRNRNASLSSSVRSTTTKLGELMKKKLTFVSQVN